MRIGTSSFNDAQLNAFANLSTVIAEDSTAISTGKSYATPSDNPIAAAKSATIGRAQANDAQATLGLDLAEQRLNIADTTLASVSNRLIRVKEIALQASNGTSSAADLKAFAFEASQILGSLITLGNAQDAGGTYIFGGARASTPPFAQDGTTNAVTYHGLGEAAQVSIGGTSALQSTPSGRSVFGTLSGAGGRSAFGVVQDLIVALEILPVPPVPGPTAPTTTLPAPTAQQTAFAAAIDGAGAAIDRVSEVRAGFGGKLNRIDAERERLTSIGTQLTIARSALDDTDVAAAITHLQQASTILQAAQKTFAQVSSLSLFAELH